VPVTFSRDRQRIFAAGRYIDRAPHDLRITSWRSFMKRQRFHSRRCSFGSQLGALATVLSVLVACGTGADLTEISTISDSFPGDSLEGSFESNGEASDLERLRAENAAELAELRRNAEASYGQMSDDEIHAALGGIEPLSPERILREHRRLRDTPLTAAEELSIRERLEARGHEPQDITFAGSVVTVDDVMQSAEELLASPSEPILDKGMIFARAFPGTAAAETFAKTEKINSDDLFSTLLFKRPDTQRTYYVVVSDDLPQWVFDAFLLATDHLESALSDDCIVGSTFVPVKQSDYSAIHPMARAFASVIAVEYEPNACNGESQACAHRPGRELMLIAPNISENRMRLGALVSLDPTHDEDQDDQPDLTQASARDAVLHELGHVIGFDHPVYAYLNPAPDPDRFRVPRTGAGTVPTIMAGTRSVHGPFSPTVSPDDKRAISAIYAGSCAYQGSYRPIGEVCSAGSEQKCQRHGGACEVARSVSNATAERCRWQNQTDSFSCHAYSAGTWSTSNATFPTTVFPGESGACIEDVSSLPEVTACATASMQRIPADLSGRCCSQRLTGKPGIYVRAFSDAFSSWYFCSDQEGRPLMKTPSWEFTDSSELGDFSAFDAVTLEPVPGWQVSSGNMTQWENHPSHLATTKVTDLDSRIAVGCISTKVTTTDNDESGIVFNQSDRENYYVFDAVPNVRRRIRQVVGGVSTNLSQVAWTGPTSWSPGVTLTVCFGDGIHTFINNTARVSVDHVFPSDVGDRFGLWNRFNNAARHAYLRTYTLADGFALTHQ
jgi:hypothetical protein